eukprot:UN05030
MDMMIHAATPQPFDEKTFEAQYRLQAAAWDALINVVGYYYKHLAEYMPNIFNASVACINQSLDKTDTTKF